MEDIYMFGKKRYEPAVPLEASIISIVQNVVIVFATIVKCTVMGVWILAKSFVLMFVPRPSKNIQNQVAMVTGGANGIGRAICVELAKCGCNVAVVDVDLEGAKECCESLFLLGVKAFPYECDVANYDEVRTLREKIRIDLGSVDIVVNNAGLLTNISLLEGRPEDVMRVLKVNLLSQFWTIRVFMPEMMANGRGHIVAIASLLSLESCARGICYSATKFGVRGLMDGLDELIQLDQLNLNVTTVFPPLVYTRKEFIDKFVSCNGLNAPTELTCLTPREVAIATVDGMLKNKKHIVLPGFASALLKLLLLLPVEFQQFIRDNFKPKVTAEFSKQSQSS